MPSEKKVAVVTGAGAGAGRAIAARFAREGYRVGLISRSAARLESAKAEIEQSGGEALVLPADVSDAEAVFAARDQALEAWGAIDVWINAAMATVVAPVDEMLADEYRRVTETTYLGAVNGTLAALRPMQARNTGAIVQVGSALAYRAIPLQSAYCAAKFAIRGFTDALRVELRHRRSAVTLTMLQMPGMNTPQFDWARNKMGVKYQPVGEVFDPEVAAEAALRAVRTGAREYWVGLSAVESIVGQIVSPTLLDLYLSNSAWQGQLTDTPQPADHTDNLFEAAPGNPGARGRFTSKAKPRALIFNPESARAAIAGAFGIAAGAVAVGLLGRKR